MSTAHNILVLDGNCSAAVSIVQSLGRAGHTVTLAATTLDHSAFRSRYVAKATTYPDPFVDKAAFQRWAELQTSDELIIPPTERTLVPLDEIRDHASLRGRVALPPAAAVAIAFDKERVRRLAERLGILCPPTIVLASPQDLRWEELDRWLAEGALVLKSSRSKAWGDDGGRDLPVCMVTTRAQLEKNARPLLQVGRVQAQAWVPGHGIGVGLLADHGETVLSFAHERLHELPLTGGGSSYRRAIAPPQILLDDSKRLLRELAWHGVAMMEFRYSPDTGRSYMMELNGRFWGSLPLATYAGIDFPQALVRLLLDGERPSASRPSRMVYARQLGRDLDWLKAMIGVRIRDLVRRGPPTRERRLILARPLAQSLVEWSRVLTGRETWDGAALDDLGPIRKEIGDVVNRYRRSAADRIARHLAERKALRIGRRPLPPNTRRILVLCTGNICRSAYVGARLALDLEPRIEVRSRALTGASGRTSPTIFQASARARSIDLGAHRSVHLDDRDLAWADLVLIMDEGHARKLRGTLAVPKVRWLGALGPGSPSIPDPISMDAEATERVLDQMDTACRELVMRLSSGRS